MSQLLLVSSSRTHGTGYLEHCRAAMVRHFSQDATVLFVPFALQDHAGYEAIVRDAMEPLGFRVQSLHRSPNPRDAVGTAEAVFIGGGNSFRLLKSLYDLDLIDTLRRRVTQDGVPYMGSSAGSNMACPTIRTTNDMPIVEPRSLTSLGLIPFQINPHFLDPDPESTHKGETREQRLTQYLEENATPVLGLREGSWLEVRGESVTLGGEQSARWFSRGGAPRELPAGADLSWMLSQSVHATAAELR